MTDAKPLTDDILDPEIVFTKLFIKKFKCLGGDIFCGTRTGSLHVAVPFMRSHSG